MNNLAKTLIAGSAILTAMLSPCFADNTSNNPQGTSGSQILNGQVNFQNAISVVQTDLYNVGGDAGVQSLAAGNAVDITTMNDTMVNTSQYNNAPEISSNMTATANNINGSLGMTNQAICNTASVSTDPAVTGVTNYQQCEAKDPTAYASVAVNNIGGSFSLANTAIGNNLEADTNAANMPINNKQINNAAIVSVTSATVSNVAGTVSVSGTAVGNNAQIIHYATQ